MTKKRYVWNEYTVPGRMRGQELFFSMILSNEIQPLCSKNILHSRMRSLSLERERDL